MASVNLLPAVLLAGPPHSGKSVLAYLLSRRLKELHVAHYLLRAVPDGEGNWYLEGDPSLVRTLRLHAKVGYSDQFVRHMQEAIQRRLLPLLVDIGGRPQGEQFSILTSCTHSVLLYKDDDDFDYWQRILSEMDLLPIAELRSSLEGTDHIKAQKPVLQGVITGLHREKEKRRTGAVLDSLVERIAGIFRYDEAYLEWEHTRRAIYPVISEKNLARQLGISSIWEPAHLERLAELVPAGQPISIYGRGPVWLAAALAVQALPSPVSMFDVRYGWLPVTGVGIDGNEAEHAFENLSVQTTTVERLGEWIRVRLPLGWIEPGDMPVPIPRGSGGAVISGALPRWLFAAMARQLALERDWVGIDDPKANRIVVVYSNTDVRVGEALHRPNVENLL